MKLIGDRGDWKRIDSSLVAKLNEQAKLKGKSKKRSPGQKPEQDPIDAQNLNGYLWVPSIKILVAKNRELNGLTWDQATDKIYTQGINVAGQRAEMPTPLEFMSFVNYLLSGNIKDLPEVERQDILNDILKIGDYRGNWLNAKFIPNAQGFLNLGIETLAFDSSGKATKNTVPLEQCLQQDGLADINSGNSQGLCKVPSILRNYKQGENIYFYFPRDTCVAGLDAGWGRAGFGCRRDPSGTDAVLGVRFVLRPKGAASKNSGGLK